MADHTFVTPARDGAQDQSPLAPQSRFVKRFQRIALLSAALVLLVGLLGLSLWIFNVPSLVQLIPSGIKPKTNTALAFIFAALALLLFNPSPVSTWRKALSLTFSVLVLLIGSLTFLQHLTGLNFGIDQLLFTEPPGALATASPNRMGPPAALAFTLTGIALSLYALNLVRFFGVAQILGFFIAFIGLVPLIGYAYDVPVLYVLHTTGTSAATAIACILLAISILLTRPNFAVMSVIASEGPGGIMARQLVLPALILPFFLEWLRMLAVRNKLVNEQFDHIILIIAIAFIFTALIWYNAIELARLGRRHEQTLHELKTASAAKDQFLAVLSHELRTPLTPAVTLVDLLKDDPRLPPDAHDSLVVVKRNIDLEVKLIDDLLDLTRVQNSRISLQLEPVDLHEVLSHILQICGTEIQHKKLTVDLQLAAANSVVEADAARIRQVFWNLLKNAVKFTPENGRITLHSRNEGAFLIITVADTGIGIEPAALPRIFNAFEQANSSIAPQFGGLGLGLAISKSLIHLHKGAISAASPGPGQGAVFTTSLPLSARPVAFKPSSTPASNGNAAPKNLRVLLVEDNADTASALARLLSLSGCLVTHAPSIGSALQLVQNQHFDLLISDLGLPDGTGHELMRRIQSIQKIPGIAISGYGMDRDIQRSIEAGFSRHLTKPLNLNDLRSAIEVFRS